MCKKGLWSAMYKRKLLTFLLAAAAALALPSVARADIWAYVDTQGVTHFAAERLDERYRLFFKGDDFDSQRDGTPRRGGSGSGLKVMRLRRHRPASWRRISRRRPATSRCVAM